MEYEQEPGPDQAGMVEVMATIARIELSRQIVDEFGAGTAISLREWYVRTFVQHVSNVSLLPTLRGGAAHASLSANYDASSWRSTEHAAIGSRLLLGISPDEVLHSFPNLYDPADWADFGKITMAMLRLFQPWDEMRYEPETENWYSLAAGSWVRKGKGNPSHHFAEYKISRWLLQMMPTADNKTFLPFKPEWDAKAKALGDVQEVASRSAASAGRFQKFTNPPTVLAKLREALEREPLMWLDASSLNVVRKVYPMANGAVYLYRDQWDDLNGKRRIVLPGELLPMHREYMATNVNPLRWLEAHKLHRAISHADHFGWTNWDELNQYEDELYLNCPTYWSFLTHAFPESQDREAFLRLYGAAMYGTNLKIIAALIGEPNAGKDTAVNWLNFLMPGQVATLPFSAFTAQGDDDRGFASLRGARVATVSGEVGDSRGTKMLAEKLKTVTSGGGKIRVAEKYEKPVDVYFDGMLFIQGNSVPPIQGGDTALFTNRLASIEFKYPFPLKAGSYDAAYRAEAPWFAQLLFINFLRYVVSGGGMKGLNMPTSWKEFGKEFADDANIHGFIENCIVRDVSARIPCTLFHATLSSLARKFGSPNPVGPYYWPKRMRSIGFKFKGPENVKKQLTLDGVPNRWCYHLSIDASKSNGMFTQSDVQRAMADAAATLL